MAGGSAEAKAAARKRRREKKRRRAKLSNKPQDFQVSQLLLPLPDFVYPRYLIAIWWYCAVI